MSDREKEIGTQAAVRETRERYYCNLCDMYYYRGSVHHHVNGQPVEGPEPEVLARSRCSTFPTTAIGRKESPVVSGVLDYFPDALVAVAQVSHAGNEQHNPGTPLHWDRAKSTDEADALGRHLLQRGELDTDGKRHSAKMAWRALALLQKEIEGEK
jgi:hypothetical protein